MRTVLLYLLAPGTDDGVSTTVHFTPQLGTPGPTRYTVRVELPTDALSMESTPADGAVLVWRSGDLRCAFTAAEVLTLARRNAGGFRLVDA
jgi:hypothetical protein